MMMMMMMMMIRNSCRSWFTEPRKCAGLPLHVTLLAVSEAAAKCPVSIHHLQLPQRTTRTVAESCDEKKAGLTLDQFSNRTLPIRQPQAHICVRVFRLPNHCNTVHDRWSIQWPGLSKWFTENKWLARVRPQKSLSGRNVAAEVCLNSAQAVK